MTRRKAMRLWLVTVGEPLPTDVGNQRLLRTGILADVLHKRGHDVTWWTSAFNHQAKIFRQYDDRVKELQPGYRIVFLKGCGYTHNFSFARLRDHRQLARQFRQFAPGMELPDIIICSYPTIDLSRDAVQFGRERRIPVVLDIRDLWPDIFIDVLPRPCRWLGRLAALPLEAAARQAFRGATAITGNTDEMVQWALRKVGRTASPSDKGFPMGYPEPFFSSSEMGKADAYWDSQGIARQKAGLVVCFFGTLGRQFAIERVLEAASRLNDKSSIMFVLCGSGDNLEKYRTLSAGLSNCLFPGWVDAPGIRSLMRRSDVGLAPYIQRKDFLSSYPNKPLEYFAGGLPVLSSLCAGPLANVLREYDCGLTFDLNNPNALILVLDKLNTDRARCREMGKNARKVYEQRFSATIVYNKMVDHLEHIAKYRGNIF